MPILNNADMGSQPLPDGHYGYSATRLERLGAAEYTLVSLVNDVSGSVEGFVSEMEEALRAIVGACRLSPRADNLLVRLVTFADRLQEAHGFKLLEQCRDDDYRGVLRAGGSTALYDATANAVGATQAYGEQLAAAGFAVNAVVFVLTDGMDNVSTTAVGEVRDAVRRAVRGEALESLLTILIGVNVAEREVSGALQDFKNDAGFTRYLEVERATPETLARLARFVAGSIAAQSRALGSGGASQSLTF